jgi:hypothetical protein
VKFSHVEYISFRIRTWKYIICMFVICWNVSVNVMIEQHRPHQKTGGEFVCSGSVINYV